jgi:glycosyltransferase involved in cell wall biosynthesis
MSGKKIKVLVLGGVWPCLRGSREAANVLAFEILSHLADYERFELSYGYVSTRSATRNAAEMAGIRSLEEKNVCFLPATLLAEEKPQGRWSRLRKLLFSSEPEGIIPGAGQHGRIVEACGDWKPDVALTIWSEAATAAASGLSIPKFAYYGNPDHKVAKAALEFESSISPNGFKGRDFIDRLRIRAICRAHLNIMKRQAAVGDVALNDAEFYRSHGVENAFYIRNMWPCPDREDWKELRNNSEQTKPIKITGNVGNLSATGNTFGLRTLVNEVLPAIKTRLGEGSFQIHLFGAHQPHPALRQRLADPHIIVRGFVDNLDAEIISSPIFLVANNYNSFKVGNTRFLHAWSLGSCVIAFRDSAEAMPEIRHGVNALLARSAEEMAEYVFLAARDPRLRRKLGQGGIATLRYEFNPRNVVAKISEVLTKISEISPTPTLSV